MIQTKFTVTPQDWTQVIKFLEEHLELSKTKIRQAMNKGGVWLERGKDLQRLRRATTELQTGDVVHVNYDPARLDMPVKDIDIVGDATQYSLWLKPAFMPMTGDEWADFHAFDRNVELACHNEREIMALYSLSEEVSGIILVAHQPRVAGALHTALEKRQVALSFRAELKGEVAKDFELGLDHTLCTLAGYNDYSDTSKVEITLKPNADQIKHPIDRVLREALANLGHAVVSDPEFGDMAGMGSPKLRLVSVSLTCPLKGEDMVFSLY